MIKIESKLKYLSILTLLFILMFSSISWLIHSDVNKQIDGIKKEQFNYLKHSYKQGLDRFNMIANDVFNRLKEDSVVIEIFKEATTANSSQRSKLRAKLQHYLQNDYKRLYSLGIRQLHFILPNNTTFLRMHKPDKFDDDMTNIRYSFTYVNYIKQPISGFEEGYSTHGFRHVFPLIIDGKYLGSIDISFSPTKLQDYIEHATKIHTHFIVNKNIFKTIAWKSNLQEKYYTSIENSDYMFTMSHHISHKKLQSSELLLITPNKEYIKKELQKGVSFSFYQEESKTDKVYIITFDPIKNIKGDKISAYIVSYVESKELKSILSNEKITVGTLFLLLLIIFVFIHHAIMHRKELLYEINHDSLTDVFNRKYFFEAADTYASKYLRLGDEFSIVMADIDWFKKVNDEYGHQCGDVILKDIATILSHNIATNDIVARYGGEEFILLMKSHEYDAHSTIQKVQKAILEHQFKCSKNEDIKITLSFGITQFKKGLTISETIKRADNALYNSKENGRNQISFA